MRFEVPQFINIPDKLFGPFTLKQAIYLVGGGALIYLINATLPSFATFILGIPIAAFSLALVFYKPNGRDFIHMVEAWVLFTASQKFFLWRQKPERKKEVTHSTRVVADMNPDKQKKTLSQNKLSDLAWSLDILDFEN